LQEVANTKRAIVCSGVKSVSSRIFVLAPSLVNTKVEPRCQAVLDIMPDPSRRQSWWNMKPGLYTLDAIVFGDKPEPTDVSLEMLRLHTWKAKQIVLIWLGWHSLRMMIVVLDPGMKVLGRVERHPSRRIGSI
jgi:hypothetical protein